MMVDEDDRLMIRIPLDYFKNDQQLFRWFHSEGVHFGDDPEKEKYDYDPPTELVFEDRYGTIALNDCLWRIGVIKLGAGLSEGHITVGRAIMGGSRMDYDSVSAIRTQIPGLTEWIGIKSIDQNLTTSEDGKLVEADVHLGAQKSIALSRSMGLSVTSTWESRNVRDGVIINAPTEIRTIVTRPRPWLDHLSMHDAIRELVELSAWKRLGVSKMYVMRRDDPSRVLSGKAIGDKWNEVLRHDRYFDGVSENQARLSFLFAFDDVKESGVRKWIRLKRDYKRAVLQFHSILYQPGLFLEVEQMNVGSALEAIGYQLAVEDGAPQKILRHENYSDRLRRIGKYIPVTVLDSDWPERSRASFMASKHSDAVQPSIDEQWSALGENILAIRYWIARRIGVSHRALKRNLSLDPVVRRYGLNVTR
jgi:hypothetical protein